MQDDKQYNKSHKYRANSAFRSLEGFFAWTAACKGWARPFFLLVNTWFQDVSRDMDVLLAKFDWVDLAFRSFQSKHDFREAGVLVFVEACNSEISALATRFYTTLLFFLCIVGVAGQGLATSSRRAEFELVSFRWLMERFEKKEPCGRIIRMMITFLTDKAQTLQTQNQTTSSRESEPVDLIWSDGSDCR